MAAVRMTEGSITGHLVKYSIPLILGNMFQLTYNAVDSIIVGRFVGKEALAAVGTSSPVMNILILGISGICIGSSVIMSRFFGAKDNEMLKKEMATTVVFGFWFSVIITLLGILFSGVLLRALQVPEEIIGIATLYLRVIFIGAPFTYVYNALSSALKSVGDSRTPLKFLAFASVVNALADIILIGFFDFGVICSAATTVIAEAASALLCIYYIYKKIPLLQLKICDLRIDRRLLAQTLEYGGITALQQSAQPVGKLLIQGAVNPLGVDMIAAFNAVNRLDDFAFTPEQSISHGIMTFVAQNRGAKQEKRAEKGFHTGLLIEFIYWVFICIVITLLKQPLMKLFVTAGSGGVVAIGTGYLGMMAFFYILPAFTNGMQGYFRGTGNMGMTLAGTVTQITVRVILVYILTPKIGLAGVAYACAAGWSAMMLLQISCYFVLRRKERNLSFVN